MTERLRFDGAIGGIGTEAGVRIVLGLWPRSPFGAIVDAMIEATDGRRILIAPDRAVADFIAATYRFDEVRVEAIDLRTGTSTWTVQSESLHLRVDIGRRTAIGWLLWAVPRPLARQHWWCRAIDPIARRARPGVRTVGTAGGGRSEWYAALDEHAITGVSASWDGDDLGRLAPIDPPVHFGFGSTPRRPSLVRVTSVVVTSEPAGSAPAPPSARRRDR